MGHNKDDIKLKCLFLKIASVFCFFAGNEATAQIGNTHIGSSSIGRTSFAPSTPGISNTPVCFAPGVCSSNSGCPVYIFIGNGDWRIPGNWAGGVLPPEILPSCFQIIINPSSNEPCIMLLPQTVLMGGSFIVMPGKKLIVPGHVFIQ